jgi:hypothetical protein
MRMCAQRFPGGVPMVDRHDDAKRAATMTVPAGSGFLSSRSLAQRSQANVTFMKNRYNQARGMGR